MCSPSPACRGEGGVHLVTCSTFPNHRGIASSASKSKVQPAYKERPPLPPINNQPTWEDYLYNAISCAFRATQLPNINFLRSFFTARPASPNTIMAAKTKAQDIIDNNSVAVFSKSYCPYCKATKSLLSEMGAKPYILELDQIGTWNMIERLDGRRSRSRNDG